MTEIEATDVQVFPFSNASILSLLLWMVCPNKHGYTFQNHVEFQDFDRSDLSLANFDLSKLSIQYQTKQSLIKGFLTKHFNLELHCLQRTSTHYLICKLHHVENVTFLEEKLENSFENIMQNREFGSKCFFFHDVFNVTFISSVKMHLYEVKG